VADDLKGAAERSLNPTHDELLAAARRVVSLFDLNEHGRFSDRLTFGEALGLSAAYIRAADAAPVPRAVVERAREAAWQAAGCFRDSGCPVSARDYDQLAADLTALLAPEPPP
jgi:hypothetical protein